MRTRMRIEGWKMRTQHREKHRSTIFSKRSPELGFTSPSLMPVLSIVMFLTYSKQACGQAKQKSQSTVRKDRTKHNTHHRAHRLTIRARPPDPPLESVYKEHPVHVHPTPRSPDTGTSSQEEKEKKREDSYPVFSPIFITSSQECAIHNLRDVAACVQEGSTSESIIYIGESDRGRGIVTQK